VPIRPLNIGKSGSQDENRITPGRVVTYEQHAKTMLGCVVAEKNGKWRTLNMQGDELLLPAPRLALLPGSVPESAQTVEAKAAFLQSLSEEFAALQEQISLE